MVAYKIENISAKISKSNSFVLSVESYVFLFLLMLKFNQH